MLRLSFVIPAYNIEEYIEECVDSLIRLPINNDEYEIIIVNDGSEDGTLSKCLELQNKYNNINLINNSNNGVSYSRNCGIDAARGNYICFVDGDDFHVNNGIINILNLCEKEDIDIGRGKYYIYKDNEYIKNNNNDCKFYNTPISGEEFLYNTIKYKENEVVPWLGLFKRIFIINNNLYFDTNISYEEDQIHFLKSLLVNGSKVIQTNDYFYAYRYRSSSATKTPSMKQIDDVLTVVELEEQLVPLAKNKRTKRYIRKYECSSFYQLTSIYGRIDKSLRKEVNKKIPFSMKTRCLLHPYDFHQFVKIFLFTFFRWFVDIVYDRRNK